MVFRICGARQNPDLFDWIFDCLLTSLAIVQAADVCASFLFVCDLNGNHQEWFGSTITNHHGVAAFDFATVPGCDHLVVGLTHPCGGTLHLLMTDVPYLVWVFVVAPIGNSDYFSLSAVIVGGSGCSKLGVLVGKFSLNIRFIEIQFVMQCRFCPGITFGLVTILLRF